MLNRVMISITQAAKTVIAAAAQKTKPASLQSSSTRIIHRQAKASNQQSPKAYVLPAVGFASIMVAGSLFYKSYQENLAQEKPVEAVEDLSSQLEKVYKVYLVKGGDLAARREKLTTLAQNESMAMNGEYFNADKSEGALVISYFPGSFKHMTFEMAKKLAGDKQLGKDFNTFTTDHQSNHSGVITLPPTHTPSMHRGFRR